MGDPQPQDFLLAIQVDANRQIDSLDPHGAGIAHFDMDTVEIDNRINRFQRP
ncbi:hypothetical protein MKFW12EY_14170 [Methylomonas koyamae]|nr:hypothetical protein MKFW12EY_14170 [Methylomonas koyamae]